MDIIWLSLDRASNKYSSTSISLAKELAKQNRVFFINNPVTYSEVIGKYIKRSQTTYNQNFSLLDPQLVNFHVITPTPTLSINWLPFGRLYNLVLSVNNKILFRAINEIIGRYNIKEYVFVNVFNPFYSQLQYLATKPLVSIYYSVDEISYSPYLSKHGPRLESRIADDYNLIFTTSSALKNKFSAQTKRAYCLPNAADLEIFCQNPGQIPDEIKEMDKPIVVYTGHVDWRMDIDLMIEVISRSPDLLFLFVGPVSVSQASLTAMKGYSNVLFIGTRHLKDLPGYLYSASCAIIPYKLNELTNSIYPLKINEYLATGIPVVATPFSEDIKMFADVILLANTPDEFIERIHSAIQTNTTAKANLRIQTARLNTWPNRVQKFWEFVNNQIDSTHTKDIV